MLGWAFRSWLNKISLKKIFTVPSYAECFKTILPRALVWKPFSPWKKEKNTHTANSLLFYLHILFDNKIRVVIEQQVLTVV